MWGFCQAKAVERVHMQFCKKKKKYWGVKTTTQNDFVYGELGRVNYVTKRYYIIIKYWFKVLSTSENKFVKTVYKYDVK